MSVALSQHAITQAEFFDWAQRQDVRYEFDGLQPVAMTGGSLGHHLISLALHPALYARLKGAGR